MTAIIRGDAARLPLPDASVDLIVTSPPYWALRSYADGGEHYNGQIGAEATPREYIAALLACTREWARVLKPEGSLFVNLGDKYAGGGTSGHRAKSLLGLPWRYALGCVDDLGLILRAEVLWSKPNGLPESVTDRVRRSHEQVFHLTKSERYFAGVDEIREPHTMRPQRRPGGRPEDDTPRPVPRQGWSTAARGEPAPDGHPLGKLPGSVWSIPSAPLKVPAELGIDHYAAYPPELVRRIILGWSPSGICTGCGEGRRPVTRVERVLLRPGDRPGIAGLNNDRAHGFDRRAGTHVSSRNTITGYACACTPYADQPGAGGSSGAHYSDRPGEGIQAGGYPNTGAGWGGKQGLGDRPKTGPWREYHLEGWAPPPARPAVVLDPFGGTGTTALVAEAHGRVGVTVDRSADYCRIAAWRTTDPGERARALGVPKPRPEAAGQESLFSEMAVTS